MNGIATQMNDRTIIRGRSSGSIGFLVPGISSRIAAPKPIRSQLIKPGSNASRPIAMNRNDAPQMPLIDKNSSQSTEEKRPVLMPRLVVRIELLMNRSG